MSTPSAAYWHVINLATYGYAWKLLPQAQALGGVESLLTASPELLIDHGAAPKLTNNLCARRQRYQVEEEWDKLIRHQITALTLNDAGFPPLLKHIYSPPPIIYTRGNHLTLPQSSLAIVGSRNITAYGKEVIKLLVPGITLAGLNVVSGLAHGVDAAALETCIKNNGQAVGVVASSLIESEISPRANLRLAHQIIERGCLVSETPPGCAVDKKRFPLRNRIVAGLSRGVLVIEAVIRSGSLITARLGLEENREVMAVPGPIFAPFSQGSLWLIKQGAKCVTELADILVELNMPITTHSQKTFQPTDPTHKIIWEILNSGPASSDYIIDQSSCPAHIIQAAITEMEINGSLRRLSNGVYDKSS